MKGKSFKDKLMGSFKNPTATDIAALAMGPAAFLVKKGGELAIDKIKENQQEKTEKEIQRLQLWRSFLKNLVNNTPSKRASIIFLNTSEINNVWKEKSPSEAGVIYIPIGYDITGITIKGHPSNGDLYVIDPRDSSVYYPAKAIAYILAKDQLLEIKNVFERLGATYIKIIYLSDKTSSKARNHADNQHIGGAYEGHKMNVSHNHTSARTSDKSKFASLSCEKKLTGKKANINWSELYWINENPTFRSEVNSIKDGLTRQFHFTEESKSYFSQTSAQMNNIEAEYSFLDSIEVNVDFGWSNEIRESLSRTVVWDIEVTIGNTETGINDNRPTLTQNETDYLTEYKCVLADGEITSRERRALERIRQKLKLSVERVAELEASVLINLTTDEREYLDEYKNVLADGEITGRERRSLERLRLKLNLSQEQVEKLEKMA